LISLPVKSTGWEDDDVRLGSKTWILPALLSGAYGAMRGEYPSSYTFHRGHSLDSSSCQKEIIPLSVPDSLHFAFHTHSKHLYRIPIIGEVAQPSQPMPSWVTSFSFSLSFSACCLVSGAGMMRIVWVASCGVLSAHGLQEYFRVQLSLQSTP
jgi:hypothetical protein